MIPALKRLVPTMTELTHNILHFSLCDMALLVLTRINKSFSVPIALLARCNAAGVLGI